ncbi:Hypothetical predicted protein [Pelobates cultripes]|uniref:Uncharacterized protein n=1 Tax=Pelobates cultripes TaxID=61616 RepID=A0AAD1R346_PELCU|nr:Hypothetical predicted protein [Pelobates cultripes]
MKGQQGEGRVCKEHEGSTRRRKGLQGAGRVSKELECKTAERTCKQRSQYCAGCAPKQAVRRVACQEPGVFKSHAARSEDPCRYMDLVLHIYLFLACTII